MSGVVKYYRVNGAFRTLHKDKILPLQKAHFKSKKKRECYLVML